jgi:Leucine-rich repeat (LRR) protein
MTTNTLKIELTIIIGLIIVLNSFGQVKKCCDTHVYEGYILTGQDKKIEISLNFLVLLDSSIVGSYYYVANWGSLKLIGKLKPDNKFHLVERNNLDSITGFFDGKLNKDFKSASGKWSDNKKLKVFDFEIKKVIGKSYWDYIKKNRSLYEYIEIKKVIADKNSVLSIDLASKELDTLPNELSQLDKIVSINLLGNQFQTFPNVLFQMKTLDEISLSSNMLKSVGPEIGQLKNLRILIINNNQISELPKEIGELTNLLYLELGNNRLTSLPVEIEHLTSLQELHIERNALSDAEKKRIRKMLPKCIIYF